jgi:hypothetical protein
LRAFWTAWTISRARPLAAQLVVELELQRDRVRALALELVAVERRMASVQVVRAELVVVAIHVDPDAAAVAQRAGDVLGVERLDRRRHLRHQAAEPRPERAVVGAHVVRAELVGLGDEAQLLDVELVEHHGRQSFDRRALVARRDDHGGAQRLAHLELAVAAGGEPEPDPSRAPRSWPPRARGRAAPPPGSRTGDTLASDPSRFS